MFRGGRETCKYNRLIGVRSYGITPQRKTITQTSPPRYFYCRDQFCHHEDSDLLFNKTTSIPLCEDVHEKWSGFWPDLSSELSRRSAVQRL